MDCIFCKIISGAIKAETLYRDDKMIVIKDIEPKAKLHYLMIPAKHYANILEMSSDEAVELGQCFHTLAGLTDKLGLKDGFRLTINKGSDAGQTVNHLHVHIMGGEVLKDF